MLAGRQSFHSGCSGSKAGYCSNSQLRSSISLLKLYTACSVCTVPCQAAFSTDVTQTVNCATGSLFSMESLPSASLSGLTRRNGPCYNKKLRELCFFRLQTEPVRRQPLHTPQIRGFPCAAAYRSACAVLPRFFIYSDYSKDPRHLSPHQKCGMPHFGVGYGVGCPIFLTQERFL